MTLGRLTEGRHQEGAVRRGGEGAHVWPVGSMTGSRKSLREMGQKKPSGAPASMAAVSRSPLLKLLYPAWHCLLSGACLARMCMALLWQVQGLSPNLVKAMILQGLSSAHSAGAFDVVKTHRGDLTEWAFCPLAGSKGRCK